MQPRQVLLHGGKGLAHALNVPIIEMPTLNIWAYQAGRQTSRVIPIIDAHRGEIFCAVYRWNNSELEKKQEDALISPADFSNMFKESVLLTGVDAEKLFPQLQEFLPVESSILQPAAEFPQMWSLLKLGFQKFRQKQFSDLNSCEPFYLRKFKGVS